MQLSATRLLEEESAKAESAHKASIEAARSEGNLKALAETSEYDADQKPGYADLQRKHG